MQDITTIGAAKFKEQCLALLDNLDPEGLVITKHGRPVARLIPYPQPSTALIGSLREHLQVHDEILSTGVAWNAHPKS